MKISKEALLQYGLLYLLLTLNQSVLYRDFLYEYTYLWLLGLIMLCYFFAKRRAFGVLKYSSLLLVGLLIAVVFVRILTNGIGLQAWATWGVGVLGCVCAFVVKPECFVCRFIKIVVTLASISIVFWCIQIIKPDILKSVLYEFDSHWTYSTWSSATDFTVHHYKAYGVLLYSFSDIDNGMVRNTSIFTEPGIYQMVLNTTLTLLLFFRDFVYTSKKYYLRSIFVIIIAIVTCQSTTGYIGMMSIILVYVFSHNISERIVRRRIIYLIVVSSCLLIADFVIRGNESLLNSVVFSKVADEKGMNLETDSGYYRMVMINICIESIINNPFGVGSKELEHLLYLSGGEGVAASILVFAAILGVIPFLFYLFWLFKPIFSLCKPAYVKLLIVFLYFNTVLAQSSAFYPCLISFTLIAIYNRNNKLIGRNVYNCK